MDKKIKEEWVAALRSGDYVQGQHMLEDIEGRLCCLGVLQKLLEPEDERVGVTILGEKARLKAVLPNDWCTHLAALNDQGIPFTGIASIIEEEL